MIYIPIVGRRRRWKERYKCERCDGYMDPTDGVPGGDGRQGIWSWRIRDCIQYGAGQISSESAK